MKRRMPCMESRAHSFRHHAFCTKGPAGNLAHHLRPVHIAVLSVLFCSMPVASMSGMSVLMRRPSQSSWLMIRQAVALAHPANRAAASGVLQLTEQWSKELRPSGSCTSAAGPHGGGPASAHVPPPSNLPMYAPGPIAAPDCCTSFGRASCHLGTALLIQLLSLWARQFQIRTQPCGRASSLALATKPVAYTVLLPVGPLHKLFVLSCLAHTSVLAAMTALLKSDSLSESKSDLVPKVCTRVFVSNRSHA